MRYVRLKSLFASIALAASLAASGAASPNAVFAQEVDRQRGMEETTQMPTPMKEERGRADLGWLGLLGLVGLLGLRGRQHHASRVVDATTRRAA